jgi:hypothetical protein
MSWGKRSDALTCTGCYQCPQGACVCQHGFDDETASTPALEVAGLLVPKYTVEPGPPDRMFNADEIGLLGGTVIFSGACNGPVPGLLSKLRSLHQFMGEVDLALVQVRFDVGEATFLTGWLVRQAARPDSVLSPVLIRKLEAVFERPLTLAQR